MVQGNGIIITGVTGCTGAISCTGTSVSKEVGGFTRATRHADHAEYTGITGCTGPCPSMVVCTVEASDIKSMLDANRYDKYFYVKEFNRKMNKAIDKNLGSFVLDIKMATKEQIQELRKEVVKYFIDYSGYNNDSVRYYFRDLQTCEKDNCATCKRMGPKNACYE